MPGHHWKTTRKGSKCKHCDRIATTEAQKATQCPGSEWRVKRWSRAVSGWKKAGRPQRSPVLVHRIYWGKCWPCSAFDTQNQVCTVCSCKVRDSGLPVLNKIAMATEHCPRRKW